MNREPGQDSAPPATDDAPSTEIEHQPADTEDQQASDDEAPRHNDDDEVQDKSIRRWKNEGGAWLPTD